MLTKKVTHKNAGLGKREQSSAKIFECEAAETRFNESVSKRSFCLEKGFILQDNDTQWYLPFVHSVITMHSWKQFCAHLDDVCVPIVREFYSNLTKEYQDVVYVWGKQVPIGSHSINSYFGITSEADEHAEYVASVDEAELNSVMADLCVAGVEWTTSPQGALTFLRSDLKLEAKVWYHFLKTRLLATTHIQTVTRECALLLHSIFQGQQINIDHIIHQEICACA